MQDSRNAPLLGVGFMMVGMFCISVNDMLIKGIAGAYPLHQIVLARSSIGIVFTTLFLMLEGGPHLLRTGQPGLHALRALLVVFANTSFYAAIVMMPLATATALYFVAPLFVTLLSIPVLGEMVGPRRIVAVAAGFGGVLMMMAPQLEGGAGWAVVLPVMAAAGYAGMSVLTRKLGQVSAASALAFYIQVAFMIVSLGVFAVAGDGRYLTEDMPTALVFLLRPWVWPETADLFLFLGLGFLSACIGYTMSQAYRQARASVVAPFEYVLMIYALFWGWTMFGEWPQPMVFAGAAVIVAAGVYVVWRERRVKAAA